MEPEKFEPRQEFREELMSYGASLDPRILPRYTAPRIDPADRAAGSRGRTYGSRYVARPMWDGFAIRPTLAVARRAVRHVDAPPAVDRQADPRHEIVVDEEQHRLDDVLRPSLAFDERGGDRRVAARLGKIGRQQHRAGQDAVDAHRRVACASSTARLRVRAGTAPFEGK